MAKRERPYVQICTPAFRPCFQLLFILLVILVLCIQSSAAATTELRVVKYASDRSTVLAQKTITYSEMEATLPVLGDGSTHYYHQGPVFIDNPDETTEKALRWNPDEDTNCMEKDMGAVKGTDVRDLCNLVGGMSAGDTLSVVASDGLSKEFTYSNVYAPPSRQGPLVITWYCSGIAACPGTYPDSGYTDGMRLVFFADTSVNPWGEHVFGNYDWHESSDPSAWYYYTDGAEQYPTTTGLSVKYVSEIRIYSATPPGSSGLIPSSSVGWDEGSIPVLTETPHLKNSATYGYQGKSMSMIRNGTLNGTIRFISDPSARPVLANNRIRNYNLSYDVPLGWNITMARLYLFISGSHDMPTDHGEIPSVYPVFNAHRIVPEKMYFDTDGDEKRYVAATYAYDVLSLYDKEGLNALSVRNPDFERTVFTIDNVLLVAAIQNETAGKISYWISEGCDVIESDPKEGRFPQDCTTRYPLADRINTSTVRKAELLLISTGSDNSTTTEHIVRFNKGTWNNIFTDNPILPSVSIPVTDYVNETGNSVTIESTIRSMEADYLVNRGAFLVISEGDFLSSSDGVNITRSSGHDQRAPPEESPVTSDSSSGESQCQLNLDTDPQGALVYMDGKYLGKTTPVILETEKGVPHRIRFALEGYQPAETTVMPENSTVIRTSLYTQVYSGKGRLPELPDDPDGVRYGGLFVTSRPEGATIFLNGINTKKTTPYVFMGLEPGKYTVRVIRNARDTYIKSKLDFNFEEQEVLVLPKIILPVDINGIDICWSEDLIIDSSIYRGQHFTLDGYVSNSTIPMKIRASPLYSFVTILENSSYVSYPLSGSLSGGDYLLIHPRTHQDLEISVDTSPQGARVFIDGFDTGLATPSSFGNISDGLHRITVTKEGYIPQQKLIDLPRRAVPIPLTSVDFILDEYPSGSLYVTSSPPGAKVQIDSLPTGEITPALFRSVPTGLHDVKVMGANATRISTDITINSVSMYTIYADVSGAETES